MSDSRVAEILVGHDVYVDRRNEASPSGVNFGILDYVVQINLRVRMYLLLLEC